MLLVKSNLESLINERVDFLGKTYGVRLRKEETVVNQFILLQTFIDG